MYTTKEKNKIYNDLKNQDFGEADLQLLTKVWPSHLLVKRAKRDPKRYADEVLYALLGKMRREDIRNNRREYQSLKEKENETPNPARGSDPDDNRDDTIQPTDPAQSETKSADETGTESRPDGLPSKADHPEQEKTVVTDTEKSENNSGSETTDSSIIEKLQEHIEQVKSEREDLREELDAEREAHEETQTALEEEKKSPETQDESEVSNSKKRKNTPTLTGETSETETSN